jgi:hypothetical protein
LVTWAGGSGNTRQRCATSRSKNEHNPNEAIKAGGSVHSGSYGPDRQTSQKLPHHPPSKGKVEPIGYRIV